MDNKLIVMRRSNKDPETGDIFVVQPKEGVYFYGKVVKSKVESRNIFFKGMYLIFIYEKCLRQKSNYVDLDRVPLLIVPTVVNKRPWTMGYFENVSKSSLTDYDLSIDYGFVDTLRKSLHSLKGDLLAHEPTYVGHYGLASFGAVAKEIHKALLNKPYLLDSCR